MARAPCCDKSNVKKGPWSSDEDAKLKAYIEQHGTGGNWIALPRKIGLKRCGKSCRLRWLNYLRPDIKHGGFSEEEDKLICSLYVSIGSRWSIIAAQLPGRTDNDIKNYWNTKLRRKLFGKKSREPRPSSAGKQPLTAAAVERMQLHEMMQGLGGSSPFSPPPATDHPAGNTPIATDPFALPLQNVGCFSGVQFPSLGSGEFALPAAPVLAGVEDDAAAMGWWVGGDGTGSGESAASASSWDHYGCH